MKIDFSNLKKGIQYLITISNSNTEIKLRKTIADIVQTREYSYIEFKRDEKLYIFNDSIVIIDPRNNEYIKVSDIKGVNLTIEKVR